jgi:hypothetical protein
MRNNLEPRDLQNVPLKLGWREYNIYGGLNGTPLETKTNLQASAQIETLRRSYARYCARSPQATQGPTLAGAPPPTSPTFLSPLPRGKARAVPTAGGSPLPARSALVAGGRGGATEVLTGGPEDRSKGDDRCGGDGLRWTQPGRRGGRG